MISQLRGTILEKQPPHLVLDVQGVGYEIDAPMSTFYRLPEVQQEVLLFTHFVVREDAHHLYGFYTREERELFRILLKVNGVGPRLALTILSRMNPDEFVRCVNSNDTNSLMSLPGIGQKTAGRLLIEMRDRLTHWGATIPSATLTSNTERAAILQDAISALVALGFKLQDATRTIHRMDDGQLVSEEMIRRALQEGVS
ncbi:MAG: Holliday junction branch migration protein RuvA [Gammaproteobacteria bacterium]|nr:Holliday junction branch migration protein RuvA [Gammaproteobacteria bacterium]